MELDEEVCFYCRHTEGLERCGDCGLVAVCADPHHWDLHRWPLSRMADELDLREIFQT